MNLLKKLVKRILQYEAKLVLRKYKPKIIAIVGSVGKTLTREAVYLVLSKKFFVRRNEKSFTTELGLPLAVIGCSSGIATPLQLLKNIFFGAKVLIFKNSYPDLLILELDADKPGDLKWVSSFLYIDILIFTAIGEVPSHIEFFGDLSSFLLEEKSIINAVKTDGVIIYNADDSQISDFLQYTATKKISCGISQRSEVKGSEFEILYHSRKNSVPTGMSFDIIYESKNYPVTIFQSIGVQNEYACLLAFAVGLKLGISLQDIITSLNKYKSPAGRMNIISGIKDSIIIDDSYNASPIAMSQTISVFASLDSAGKKIAVFGDMLELGKYSAVEHKKLAELLKDKVWSVICVGFRMRKVAEELGSFGWSDLNIISVGSSSEAVTKLKKLLETGDTVLVKGSQAMRMEKVVEEVMKHPENKEKLLVRQEPEWLTR